MTRQRSLRSLNETIQRTTAAITLATTVYHSARRLHSRFQRRNDYDITVVEGTELFMIVQRFLLRHVSLSDIRSVNAVATPFERNGAGPRTRGVLPALDGDISLDVELAGHNVKIYSFRDEQHFNFGGHDFDVPMAVNSKRGIRIICPSVHARDAILAELGDLLRKHDRGSEGARCFTLGKWDGWEERDYRAVRPLDTIYMPDGHLEDVTADLQRFLNSEEDYIRLGAPWHRGYLFYGPPGTGKTSLAKALAHHFNLDVYMVAIPDLKKDATLSTALSQLNAPAVLLLEDIDVASAATKREEADDSVSMSGLLNALDGLGTPHGLVTIMTSNHPEKLDEALTRAGRIDYHLECPTLSGQDLRRMAESVLGIPANFEARDGIAAAEVMEVIKRNLHETPEYTMAQMGERFAADAVRVDVSAGQ